jgi:hypothetical protein
VPVIYTGNVHARKTRGLPLPGAPPGFGDVKPLSWHLRDRGDVHLGVNYQGGTAWMRVGEHGRVQAIGEPGPVLSSLSVTPSSDRGYDAYYAMGRLTASPPAVPGAGR